jgi:hypothetical protein
MTQLKDIPKERNITRIDSKPNKKRSGTHGWEVRFSLHNKEVSKFFSDNAFGGIENALDEARSFRDSFAVDWNALKTKEGISKHPEDVKKVLGVIFVKGKKKATSNEYCSHWRAQWYSGPQKSDNSLRW